MHRTLSIIGSLLFQLFFGAALFGGIVGTVLCAREWSEAAGEDVDVLPAVALMAIALAIVGLIGIIRFGNSQERQLDSETDLAPLRSQKAISNIVCGSAGLVGGIGIALFQLRSPEANPGDMITIPVVAICVAVLQLFFGIWQLIRPEQPVT